MKEIGIKALGASSKDIYIQFILENMIIFNWDINKSDVVFQ